MHFIPEAPKQASMRHSVEKDNIKEGQILIHLDSQKYSLQFFDENDFTALDDYSITTPQSGTLSQIICLSLV